MDKLTIEYVSEIDKNAIAAFNNHPGRRPEHRLQTRVGPFLPTANIRTAPVVMLLANPGYSDDLAETPDGCEAFTAQGWPFGHIHPDAPQGAREWTRKRLRVLIEQFGDHFIANNLACVQLIPWASVQFHEGARLPSRDLILQEVKSAGERGALLVVMRIARLWKPEIQNAKVIQAKNPRSPYMSPGNLKDFDLVVQTLQNKSRLV